MFKKNCCAAVFIILLLLILSACSHQPQVAVEVLPQYDVLFSNEDGWTGADGAYSVALNQDTIAWFFGDTWIGQIKNGQHVKAVLVNNSVAIQHGRNPAKAIIEFHFGRAADGSPTAWIRPADGRGWFWVFDAVMTPKGLYAFLIQLERASGAAVFDFKIIGVWLGYIANPMALPTGWRIRQTRIPWAEFSASRGILWGSAVLRVNDVLYIYGTEEGGGAAHQKHMILARVPMSMLADFSQWRFYDNGRWVSDYRRASRLCQNVPHEYSVSYLTALKRYALIYSQEGLSNRILARLAPAPQGPWSDPVQLYQCPEAQWDDSIFCYAAKAHAALSGVPGELVITYIASSVDFKAVAGDARLYRPRFLRVIFTPMKK